MDKVQEPNNSEKFLDVNICDVISEKLILWEDCESVTVPEAHVMPHFDIGWALNFGFYHYRVRYSNWIRA
jgi:hypothetical protein